MNSREKIREKNEQNRRQCLIKKIKFYQYLICYGGQQNNFIPGVETKNNTASLFFPSLNLSTVDNTPKQTKIKKIDIKTMEASIDAQQGGLFSHKQKYNRKAYLKETFRPTKRQQIANVQELMAKSMTPSIRMTKTNIDTKNCQYKPIFSKEEQSLYKISLSQTRAHRLSPKKRTYIGRVHYIKESKSASSRGEKQKIRKQSICPWQVDF